MGSYTFRWNKPAEEVIITGIFDDWARTIQMDKKDGHFEKTIHIPAKFLNDKIHYKFVVDGDWKTSDAAPHEEEPTAYHYDNNYLLPEQVTKDSSVATTSTVTPDSTTATMAGQIPKEPNFKEEKELPGAFPETPAAETPAADTSADNQTFGVNPIPASVGAGNPISLAPGEVVPASSTLTKNTVASTVEDDVSLKKSEPDSQEVKTQVLPATEGLGNPIHLAPGEKVPDASTLTKNTVSSTIEDDLSLKKNEPEATVATQVLPATEGLGNPIHLAPGEKVPDPSTFTSNTIQSTVSDDARADALPKETQPESNGVGLFGVPPVTSTLIPESSLPINGGPAPSKEVDAGPTIQSAAPTSTTATLAGQVPKEPTADVTIQSAAPTSTTAALAAEVPKASDEVPEIVHNSQEEAKVEPEASASAKAVAEKTAVETELLKEVPKEPAASESGFAPSSEAVVPDPVKESIAAADAPAEAATNPAAIAEKSAVEEELKKTVPVEEASGQPAPTNTAATSATAPGGGTVPNEAKGDAGPGLNAPASAPAVVASSVQKATAGPVDSRDVSPMSRIPTSNHPNPGQTTEPTVTTGTTTTTAPKKTEATPTTPKKQEESVKSETPGTAESTAGRKKRNRLSGFFKEKIGEIKNKLHHS